MGEKQLQQYRRQIDRLDLELLAALSRRAALARRIGDIKSAGQPARGMRRPQRERQVLQQVAAANRGPLPEQAVRNLFREIIDACLALEEPPAVACLAAAASRSEQAAIGRFGPGVRMVPQSTVRALLRALDEGLADRALVPVTDGFGRIAAQLASNRARICGELEAAEIRFIILGPQTATEPP